MRELNSMELQYVSGGGSIKIQSTNHHCPSTHLTKEPQYVQASPDWGQAGFGIAVLGLGTAILLTAPVGAVTAGVVAGVAGF